MKKFLSILLTLCFCVNISFAFDPYADEEVEKKSYKKLYYGIALTLLGGFLAYDGFSLEKVDVSKPSVDFVSVLHAEWTQQTTTPPYEYELKSGWTEPDYYRYDIKDENDQYVTYMLCEDKTDAYNRIYNNGNVDLRDITIEVRYKYHGDEIIVWADDITGFEKNGKDTSDGYHVATFDDGIKEDKKVYENISLAKGESLCWKDFWGYSTTEGPSPSGDARVMFTDDKDEQDGTKGLNFQGHTFPLMDVRVILKKHQQYTPIYETKHKSDLEGVAGVFIGIAGIYFIIDHFFDMHKFNAYAKRHHLNLRVATASNQYKLMLQKRI